MNHFAKHKFIYFIALSVLSISITVYFVFFYTPKTDETPLDEKGTPIKDAPKLTKQAFPLKMYDTALQIKQLQNYLNKNYNAGLKMDGNWGQKTQDAFKNKFKASNGEYYTILTEFLYNKLELSKF